jgi:uncharacterized Zn-binding protein involved in type VI secretion
MGMMPALSKNGTDSTESCIYYDVSCQNSGCAFISEAADASSSSNVLCNGYDMMAECDTFGRHVHTGGSSCDYPPCNETHDVILNGDGFSPNVFVNGKKAAVAGQEMFCHKLGDCTTIIQKVYKTKTTGGASNVLVNT